MIGSCKNCGHALIVRDDILLHATQDYSGKLCMFVSAGFEIKKPCNCINPQLRECDIHKGVLLSLPLGECPFCIAENPY